VTASSLPELEPRRLSVADYHRMIEAGILDEDERLELLEGVIVAVSPPNRPHAYVIQRLNALLVRQLGPRYAVLPQLPLTLGEQSEPEPDLAVVDAAAAASKEAHPSQAFLVIEVADDSLRKDRLVKGPLYARFGVPEYWIVNLPERCVEVHRDPDVVAQRYRSVSVVRPGEALESDSVPGLKLRTEEVLG
jgi:Uma2 family endonuclease